MKSSIEQLCASFFHPHIPSRFFVESLYKYDRTEPSVTQPVEQILYERSKKAFALYKTTKQTDSIQKLIHVFLCLSDNKPSLQEELRLNLKRVALGFCLPQFCNVTELKGKLPYHIYCVIYHTYLNSHMYRKIKLELLNPQSMCHRHYLATLQPLLHEYEHSVMHSEYDFLKFYAGLFAISHRLSKASLLSDAIKERRFLGSIGIPELRMEASLHKFYNDCTRDYLTTGIFTDTYSEYFIKNNVLDYGLIPFFISKSCAEKVEYIGKYVCLLNGVGSLCLNPMTVKLIMGLDFSSMNVSSRLDSIMAQINDVLMQDFIKKYQIEDLLKFIYSVFLFGRVDFIDHLFLSLKKHRKTTRRNFITILEASLEDAFPGCPFNQCIDVFVKPENDSLNDSFSLYCKLEYPVTVLLDEQFVLKLVYVFRFLWKLKKVDVLSRRVGVLKYVNLIGKMMFYAFNEVIMGFDTFCWEQGMAMDILKKELNRKLDKIIERLFINTKAKKIEYLLFYMEKAFSKPKEPFDDSDLQNALKGFYNSVCDSLQETALFDLRNFIV